MNIAINWLNAYLSVPQKTEEVAALLTDTGLEVESITTYKSIENSLDKVVVGEVITCKKHPGADRLKVTEVRVGTSEHLQIVCGAPNVAAGQKVIVAKVGSILYPDGNKMPIKKAKIRGMESNGMICAENELGIGNNDEGILELPKNAKPGIAAADYFKIYKDDVLDIDITPNRVDAASYLGVAKDVVARQKVLGKKITLKNPATDVLKNANSDNEIEFKITLEDADLCPRYAGIALKDVDVKPSPEWLQNRLKSVGLKPQNNVVDITNFVLLETGHPLHAFDVDKIKSNHIKVRPAKKDEYITTLDGEKRQLKAGQLLICDAEKPMCIAGIYGGIDSGVTEKTKCIFIESAYFNPASIRKTAKYFGLNTDASFRFERGADIAYVLKALSRAVNILKDTTNCKIASPVFDEYPMPVQPVKMAFKYSFLQKIAGISYDKVKVMQTLQTLDIKIEKQTAEELKLIIPTSKVDVTRPIDVVEEIMRIYGYNHRPASENLKIIYTMQPELPQVALVKKTRHILVHQGYLEAVNLSFIADKSVPKTQQNGLVKIKNPISEDLNVLRTSHVYGLLQNVAYNLKRQHSHVSLFEFGRVFKQHNEQIEEKDELGIIISGKTDESWHSKSDTLGFFHLKGILEHVFNALQVAVGDIRKSNNADYALQTFELAHPSKAILAEISEIKQQQLQALGIKQSVWFAAINWENVLKYVPKKIKPVSELPKYPTVRRDLAMLIPEEVKYVDLESTAKKQVGKILEKVNIFDFYQDKGMVDGKKSYALSFTFRDANQTLTDKKVDVAITKIFDAYKKAFGAVLR